MATGFEICDAVRLNVRQTTERPKNAIGAHKPKIWQGGRAVLAHRHPAGILGHPGAIFWRLGVW